MQAWTPEAVAGLAEVPYRTLMRWLKAGDVHASIAPPRGERRQVLLGLDDVLEACVVATLRRTGVSMEVIANLLGRLREDGVSLQGVHLITVDPEEVLVYRSAREAMLLLAQPGQKTLLPIARWRELAQKEFPHEQAIVA